MNNERINLSFDLSSLRGKVIAVASEKNEEIKVWTNRQLKGADIFLWSSNQAFDHNCSKLLKKIREAIGEKKFTDAESDIKEAKVARSPVFLSTVLCTNAELFKVISETQFTEIDSSNEGGYTPIQLYFFMFLNHFTFNCPSLETVTEEISAKLFDPSNSFLYTKLSDSFSIYKDTLSLNGGDYSKILLNNSLLDYFQANFYLTTSQDPALFGSLTTSKDLTPHKEILLSRMMTSSSDVLMEVKYFLVKIIFIILYQELQYFYVAWEFLLHQLLSDALTVRTVLSSITSFKTEDYHIQFFMMQTLTTKNTAKDFLSQRRHPLRKVEEISNMLSRHLPKGSDTLSEDAHSLMAKEINEVYQKHDQRDLTYFLCGRIHRHRDNWIRNNVTQNTDLIEQEKRILTSSLNQSMKWIGYSLNSNASKDSPLSMSTFQTRKKELMNGWKDSIDQLIFTLIESRLENWILPLLYLLIESIYCYQLLITHLLQLNLFQLPYSCSLLTVERKEFPSCLTFINLTESFQPPESNYDYHVELAELSWILLKDSRHVNFTSFNQGKAWLDNCHFPFDPSIQGESKNERNLDLEKIDVYFQFRRIKSVENEAREIIINSETADVLKKLSNIFGGEMPGSKILRSVLFFNCLFNGEKQTFMNILPDHFEEIHLMIRKHISTIFDYMFTLYLLIRGSFIRSPLILEKPFEEFIKDCKSDESLGRKYFPFLFEKLPLHYLNQFYAAVEIIIQESISYIKKFDIKIFVICAIVRLLNSSDSIAEGNLYEVLNEIRIASRFRASFVEDKRNIKMEEVTTEVPKKRVNSKESREIRFKENLSRSHEETSAIEELVKRKVQVESLTKGKIKSMVESVMNCFCGVKTDAKSGRFILLEKEIPLPGYATFTGLKLMIGDEPMLTECTVSFTNQRLLMTRKLNPSSHGEIVGWALDRQFIHAIKDCAGGLFKSSKRVRLVLKHPRLQQSAEADYFELKFPEEDFSELKQSFLNVLKIVDLCQACEEDRLEDFENLLQSNSSLVNIPIDSKKKTLLIMACALNKGAFARYLLQFRNIDINKTIKVQVIRDGKLGLEVYGALYYACINNMEEVVQDLLLIPTADLNILYTDEYTALQYAFLKDIECQSASNPNSRRSYANIIAMLMSSRKVIWKITSNKIFAIPALWILNATGDTQKAILLSSRANELPADLRRKLAASIQEKQSYKSFNGQVARMDSSSTITTKDTDSFSKIHDSASFQSINSNVVSSPSASVVNLIDPIAKEINVCKAFFDRLGVTPTLQLSFAKLKALKICDDIIIAKSSRSYNTMSQLAKQKKQWKIWVDHISVSIEKQLPESLRGEDFESIKTFLLVEIQNLVSFYVDVAADEKVFEELAHFTGHVESLVLLSKEPQRVKEPMSSVVEANEQIENIRLKEKEKETKVTSYNSLHGEILRSESSSTLISDITEDMKSSSMIKSTQFISSKVSIFDPVLEEISQWKSFFERLGLPSTTKLAFVILKILEIDESIKRAMSSKMYITTLKLSKQQKEWMSLKDQISSSIGKQINEPLTGEDFEAIKIYLLGEIEYLYQYHIDEAADEDVFEILAQFKDQVKSLTISSKKKRSEEMLGVTAGVSCALNGPQSVSTDTNNNLFISDTDR
eukprot:gene1785-1906_t